MTAVARLYQYLVVDRPDGPPVQAGSLSEARSVALGDGEVICRDFKIAPETAVKIFDAAEDEALAGFDVLWLESDSDVWVQFTTDAGTTDAYDVKKLAGSGIAGQFGPALVLGSDVTQLLDGAIDQFTGTADSIGELWVYNSDDTDTARIRMVVAT